ncbi:zinc finger, CCHC-type containing protein [Tanacetum coccineum]
MAGNMVKDMTMNFGKLDKVEGHDFRRWQKKMYFLLTTLKVVYVLTTPMSELLEDATVEAIRIREKLENDDYICRGHILNEGFQTYFEMKYGKDDLSVVQLGNHLRIEESLRAQDSDKGKGKEVGGPSINKTEDGNNKHNKQNKGKKWSNENNSGSGSNKKPKLECWKCGKTSHFKRDCRSGNKKNANVNGSGKGSKDQSQDQGIIHETTTPYTPQQNGVAERKNRAFKEMVNFMLSDPKRKTLGEKDIDCIFVGYAEHSKAYRFYVIEPNEFVSINSIIESRDSIFDENYFSSIPRPKDIIPNVVESQKDDHSDDVPSEIPEPHNGKRVRKAKSYGSNFQRYLVEGSRDQVGSQYSYCYSIEEDPRTYDEAMQSRDAAFWKEAIDDEIGFIMENNTWVLSDLPPGCKPLCFKWIFKRKMKVDGTIDKFKARLCVYSKFDSSGKGVIICLYVDDMLIFDTDHNQVDKTKNFLSSRFSMKDMGEADVILGIKIKRENKGIVITQSRYIEKLLKKFNHEDCSPVSTLMDQVQNLKPNTGKPVDQLEYSRAIGSLMYAMTSTTPDIAYVIGRLSRFTSNPSRQHWKAITRVFKYLRSSMNYGLSYVGYPSVSEAYSDASWINHVEDSSSTSR